MVISTAGGGGGVGTNHLICIIRCTCLENTYVEKLKHNNTYFKSLDIISMKHNYIKFASYRDRIDSLHKIMMDLCPCASVRLCLCIDSGIVFVTPARVVFVLSLVTKVWSLRTTLLSKILII